MHGAMSIEDKKVVSFQGPYIWAMQECNALEHTELH